MSKRIKIFETTLRDGEQSPGATMNRAEKLEIAFQLARLGVDIIEAGFPIASPGDFEAVAEIGRKVKGPIICALARTLPQDVDRAGAALKNCPRPRLHTFIATSPIHMKYKLKATPEEVLKMAVAAVKRSRNYCDDVEFSAEDAGRSEPEFLYKIFAAVIEAGATVINIPETVGYTMPQEFGMLVRQVIENTPGIKKVDVSVHCHNDLGLATANSLAGVLNGATQVECTINGIGERAGNAALEEIVMTITTRKDIFKGMELGINTKEIYKTSRLVSSTTGIHVQPNKAIVGANAFAHEAGIHQDGVLKKRQTYEIMDATSIGLKSSQMVMGKHSGRHAFAVRMAELGYELKTGEINQAYEKFIALADQKKTVTDQDLVSIVSNQISRVPETYVLKYVQATTGNTTRPVAIVQLEHEGKILEASATGDGPVDAVYKTIDKIIAKKISLINYSIQALTAGTDALGEVVVRIRDSKGNIYAGRSAATDVIVASAKAYLQAINRRLYQQRSLKHSS